VKVKNSNSISHRGEEMTRVGYEVGNFAILSNGNIIGENATIFGKTFATTKHLISAKRWVKM